MLIYNLKDSINKKKILSGKIQIKRRQAKNKSSLKNHFEVKLM